MPFVTLNTNIELDSAAKIKLAHALSALACKLIDKPEDWVMTLVLAGQSMVFASSTAPCAYLECKSIDLDDAQLPEIAHGITEFLAQQLHIEPTRVYIEFCAVQAHQWGWNGSTF